MRKTVRYADSAKIFPLLPTAGPTCYTGFMIDEQQFRTCADQALEALKQHLFQREDQTGDFETEEQGGVLQVIFEEPAAKFVITANAPVRQIWISALTTSFKLDCNEIDGSFTLAKTGEALLPLLDRLIDEQRQQ